MKHPKPFALLGASSCQLFLRSVFWLLVATSAIKFISAFGSSYLLARYDTLLPITVKQTLFLSAALEVLWASAILFLRWPFVCCLITGSMGAQFVLYHVASHLAGVPRPCPCLGNLTSWLHLPPQTAEFISFTLAMYFFIGGAYLCWRIKRDGKAHVRSDLGAAT